MGEKTRDVLISDLIATKVPKQTETPIADSLREHGSKYYNHERYDEKLIKAIEKLEREVSRCRAVLDYIARVPMERSQVMEMARKASEQK